VKASELKNLSVSDLKGELAEQYRTYFNLRFREAAGEDIGSADMKKARRVIAQMKTVLTEKEKQAGAQVTREKT